MHDLWLDVMAGSIGAMLWAAGALYARRLWLETNHPLWGVCLFVFIAFGLGLFVARGSYWLAERQGAIAAALQ